ncbi:metal ABC transporter solute-binding protein, Zn/Mn family [Halonatronum saccharophilum]|uniref:metal ABC transporter solute-binding protein, Zn/Mn family n=1 Tax=Halonatronum saccharophilum TaxID=150060 RepID=UPI0004B6D224|nr:zinc ABC transporter substrate-binding protein [Halonatronum saccharophilum]
MKLDARIVLVVGLVVLLIAFVFLFAFGGSNEVRNDENLNVVATYSIIYDFVKNVGGDRVEITTLVPIGDEPEEYEPLPEDMIRVAEADIVISNGLGMENWLSRIIENVGPDKVVVEVTDGIIPFYLGEGILKGDPDPHAWLDPKLVRDYYIPNIVEALSDIDPEGAQYYQENANAYIEEVDNLHQWIKAEVAKIPEANRVLISSEGAYRYFCESYGFEEGFIWQINAHEEGSPGQIARLVDSIRDKGVKALFTETSVDRRPMEMVSEETGAPIKGVLYSDSIGEKGSKGETYLKLMTHNVKTIVNALKER